MTTARSAIAPAGSFGNYHCVSRCVRRAWLCGFDKLTGRSFEHRRAWLVERMNELASIFAVRVLAYCAMSNHLHLALQFDPAWVEGWSNRECAERWTALYGGPADETDEQNRQWAYARSYSHSLHRQQHLPLWLHHYNWHRPHAGINYQTPIQRLQLNGDNLVALHS